MYKKSIQSLIILTFLTSITELSAQKYHGSEEYDEDDESSWITTVFSLIIIGFIVNKIWFDKD